jgi:hypothetical protein
MVFLAFKTFNLVPKSVLTTVTYESVENQVR